MQYGRYHRQSPQARLPRQHSGEVLRLDGITKVYGKGETEVRALQGVDLSVMRGERISVIGPSGCGKSTLMHILGLLDVPSGGTLLIDGLDVSNVDENTRAKIRGKKIGFIFQSFHLVSSLNALENVMLPMMFYDVPVSERERRAKAALEQLGMGNRLDHRPNELSGGQRQRVAIARALVNDPAILLADEPTGNLDSKSGEDVMAIFSQLHKEGRTIIVVTHDKNVAAHGQKIIYMKDGKIEKIEAK